MKLAKNDLSVVPILKMMVLKFIALIFLAFLLPSYGPPWRIYLISRWLKDRNLLVHVGTLICTLYRELRFIRALGRPDMIPVLRLLLPEPS